MAKINDTSIFPITTPAGDDIILGTDVSDTTNSADGETVNFTINSINARVAGGVSGAPRLHGSSASPTADADAIAGLPAITCAASGQAVFNDAVNYTGSFSDVSTSSTSYVSAGTVTIQRLDGTIRFQARQSSDTSDTRVKLEKNGVTIYESPVTSSGAVTRTVDASATQDDEFEWFIRKASSGSSAILDTFLIGADDYYERLGVPTPASFF